MITVSRSAGMTSRSSCGLQASRMRSGMKRQTSATSGQSTAATQTQVTVPRLAVSHGDYDAFKTLASKLVAVPKSEIDEQREAQT